MAHTDALLNAIGARRSSPTGTSGEAFEAALLDFVCDLDLLGGIAEIDATPIPVAALRSQPRRTRRPGWRVLLPATSGGVAALFAMLVLVFVGGPATTSAPALSATAESKQLLSHASLLLTAAQTADGAARTRFVTEAKADLKHVRRLLPLAPPPAQPAIRSQLQQLNERVEPMTPTPARSRARAGTGHRVRPSRSGIPAAGGATSAPRTSGDVTAAPTRRPPPPRLAGQTDDQQARTESQPAPQQTAPPAQPATDGTRTPQRTQDGSGRLPPDSTSPRSPRP